MHRTSAMRILLSSFTFLLLALPSTYSLFQIIGLCDSRRGLSPRQQTLCRSYEEHMDYVLDGSRLGMTHCRTQFEGQRWNCTYPRLKLQRFLHPHLEEQTKETAFVHSIIAAGTMHAVSRACMESKLPNFCHCSKEPRPGNLEVTKTWGGCGDNLPYGYMFSKDFVDGKENTEQIEVDDYNTYSNVLQNLHNNEAGRIAVSDKSRIQCRCHGVSKNCATKYCYRQLQNFKQVAEHLSQKHDSAVKVRLFQKAGNMPGRNEMRLVETEQNYRKYSARDLVYTDDSPSYCKYDPGRNSFGTRGRQCSMEDPSSRNHCNHLCCGRGHISRRQTVREKCDCKFFWCCEVKCNTCESEKNVHYCK